MSEKAFVEKILKFARDDMKMTGVLASLTAAQACLESGYGTTDLAKNACNFFGMKKILSGNTWASAWDGLHVYSKQTAEQKKDGTVYYVWADFRKYPDMAASVRDHSLYLTQAKNGNKLRYDGLIGCSDYKKAAQIVKNGGYATDVKYVDKICSLVERWNLDRYDSEINNYRGVIMLNINKEFISKRNINGVGNPCKYIIIHETDNTNAGAGARTHAKAQFNGHFSNMSVHYYCGSDGIYQAAEHTCKCWHIGRDYGGGHSVTDATNNNSIGIEICVNSDGDYNKARENAINLVKYLIQITGIPASRVIRHYDAKGKYCPRKMMDNGELWNDFKRQIADGLVSDSDGLVSDSDGLVSESVNESNEECAYMFEVKTVRKGSKGNHVLLVQEILRARGFKGKDKKALTLDGDCGDNTVYAITKYQESRKGACGAADGIAGAKTLADLIGL